MAENIRSVEASEKASKDLSDHQRAILDYATMAASAAYKAETDVLISRTRVVVNAELNEAFAAHNKLTLGRKVTLGVGAVVVFALGWLGKGWANRNDKPAANSTLIVD